MSRLARDGFWFPCAFSGTVCVCYPALLLNVSSFGYLKRGILYQLYRMLWIYVNVVRGYGWFFGELVARALKNSGNKGLTKFHPGIVVRCSYHLINVGWEKNAALLLNVLYKRLNTTAFRLYKTTASRCGKNWEWICCWKMLKAADREWFYTMGVEQEAVKYSRQKLALCCVRN